MRKVLVVFVLGIVLICTAFLTVGCTTPGPFAKESSAQPGESAAEGRRRHIRNARVNQQNMMRDMDFFWQTDKPSTLTDMRIP